MTEDRRQKTEDRGQKTEACPQRSRRDRGQKFTRLRWDGGQTTYEIQIKTAGCHYFLDYRHGFTQIETGKVGCAEHTIKVMMVPAHLMYFPQRF